MHAPGSGLADAPTVGAGGTPARVRFPRALEAAGWVFLVLHVIGVPVIAATRLVGPGMAAGVFFFGTVSSLLVIAAARMLGLLLRIEHHLHELTSSRTGSGV